MIRGGPISFSVRVLCILGFVALFEVPLSQQDANVVARVLTRKPDSPSAPAALVLDYSADRRITINGEAVTVASLQSRLASLYRLRTDRVLWISGDGSLRYGDIAFVIEAAKAAGVDRIGVITPAMRSHTPTAR